MRFLYLIIFFVSMLLLDLYLKSNIGRINDGSVNLHMLGIFIVLSSILLIKRIWMSGNFVIRRSVLILFLFLNYYVIRVSVDMYDGNMIMANTIATSGGVILFYMIGLSVSIMTEQNSNESINFPDYYRFYSYSLLAYLIIILYTIINVFYELAPRIRLDILLIDDLDGAYQRPGNFLIISYLTTVVMISQFMALRQQLFKNFRDGISFLIFIFFILNTIIYLFVSQMIGSNHSAVIIFGLAIVALMIMLLLLQEKYKNYISEFSITVKDFFIGKMMLYFIKMGLVSIISFILLLFAISYYLEINLNMTRIGGFDGGDNQSTGPRLELIKNNFLVHIEYSPIFGNMNVDCITTGCGTYVHSFLLSTLTHTGLIGFYTMICFLILAYVERFQMNGTQFRIYNNISNILLALYITVILFISTFGVFMTSPSVWFAIGLIFTGVIFEEVQNGDKKK